MTNNVSTDTSFNIVSFSNLNLKDAQIHKIPKCVIEEQFQPRELPEARRKRPVSATPINNQALAEISKKDPSAPKGQEKEERLEELNPANTSTSTTKVQESASLARAERFFNLVITAMKVTAQALVLFTLAASLAAIVGVSVGTLTLSTGGTALVGIAFLAGTSLSAYRIYTMEQ